MELKLFHRLEKCISSLVDNIDPCRQFAGSFKGAYFYKFGLVAFHKGKCFLEMRGCITLIHCSLLPTAVASKRSPQTDDAKC